MIRFVPKEKIEERRARGRTDLLVGRKEGHYTEGGPGDPTKYPGQNARVRRRVRADRGGYKSGDEVQDTEQRHAAHRARRGVPTKQRSSTELDRIGVAILEGLDSLVEGKVKQINKAKKRALTAQRGRLVAQGRTKMTDRERKAAEKGGRGGGAEAQRRGVTASYVAAGRESQEVTGDSIDELKSSTLQSYHQKRAAQLRMMPGTSKPKDFKKGWKGVKKAEEKLKDRGDKVPEIPTRKDAKTPAPKKAK